MSDCTACGTANEPGRKFCAECGQRLSSLCASCGAANQAGAKFCGECGSSLQSAAAAPLPPAGTTSSTPLRDDTERKLVTVLFVDLVGSTTLAEKHDAEDVREMLRRYFDDASDAVRRHGGVVEKFIGDAVMAVWGTPVAHEDDAERAVRASLEIVDRVEGLGRVMGLPLQARAGVLTGEAVATVGAIDQGLVAGDLVNTASRLQGAAPPGAVYVGERTQRATNRSIAYSPVGPIVVKGRDEPVPAYEALRIISEMRGSNRGNAPEPPFVGREEQLRLAKELLHATGREKRPRLLHISGVAGIGKSRLVRELSKYLDGLTETTYWHAGRCPSYGEGVSFWALTEMVRGRARIAESDEPDLARRKLAACLAEHISDVDERRWIEPRLGYLLGLEGAPSGERDELFGAWRRFFERVAERGTVALVVEDLQWADPGLMDFLESLLESSRTSPILVLTLARPELMDRRPGWSVGVRNSAVLHLDRLADAEIEEMVTGYVDGLPEDGLARLVARAEGVPMYAVETVRMLADRGVLDQDGDRYVVSGELGSELDIPETLHALVAARLDGLPDSERALVQDASVAGLSFTVPAVVAVSGRDAAEIEDILRQLVRKEVLEQNTDPRSAERGQYRFVQSVIQEVAYSTLSKASRRAKHLECARWFDGLGEEELAGVVANHYLMAYRSSPSAPDAEEIAAQARSALGTASDRALALGSPDQALAFALQALELSSAPSERGPFHERAALAAVYANDPETGLDHQLAALAAYRAVGDLSSEARVLGSEQNIVRVSLQQRLRLAEWARDVLERLGPDRPVERARVLSLLANADNAVGDYGDALRHSEEAVVLAQGLDDDLLLLEVSSPRIAALNGSGRIWESEQMAVAHLDLARRVAGPVQVTSALMHLAMRVTDENPREGFELFLECARTAETASLRMTQDIALSNAAEIGVDAGEWAAVDAIIAELMAYDSVGHETINGVEMTRLMLRAHRGDPLDAIDGLVQLEALVGAEGDSIVRLRTWLYRVAAYLRLLGGDRQGALESVRNGLETEPSGVNAPNILWTGLQLGSMTRDPALLGELLGATTALRGRWVRQVRRTGARLEVALREDGDGPDPVDDVLQGWLDEKLPLDHAYAVLAFAHAAPAQLPPEHLSVARSYLIGLGAVTLLRMLDDATA